MSDQRHILSARGVTFGYRPAAPVLHEVDLQASSGRLLCLLGPNGSGKTTLLRCLLGRLAPSGGSIELDGKPLGAHSARELARLLGYVPQTAESAFAFSVWEIVLLGRLAHTGTLGLAGEQDRKVARAAMEMTDTLGLADRALGELSGGEAQRVMIARALAQQPSVILLDEPTSHLDIRNQLAIYRMMVRLAHDWQMAVVCVSHDVNLAARFADDLVVMRQGRVLATGGPADVIRRDVLAEAYEVEVDLVDAGDQDVPIVRAR